MARKKFYTFKQKQLNCHLTSNISIKHHNQAINDAKKSKQQFISGLIVNMRCHNSLRMKHEECYDTGSTHAICAYHIVD